MAFRKHFVVEVIADKDIEDLHPDDLSLDGSEPAYGKYLITVNLNQEDDERQRDALQTLHENVGINRPGDFLLTLRKASTEEVMHPEDHGIAAEFTSDSLNEPQGPAGP